jgi:hypothetical protein
MRPIFSWAVLHFGSFNPQILSSSCSRYPIPTSTEFFYVMHMASSDYMQHIERYKVFTIDFPSDKSSQAYHWNTPHFFFGKRYFKWPLGGCDVHEQTFVDDGIISLLLSLLHIVVETARPYCWARLAMVHQSIFHLDLFSFNPSLAGHFFLSA